MTVTLKFIAEIIRTIENNDSLVRFLAIFCIIHKTLENFDKLPECHSCTSCDVLKDKLNHKLFY